MRTLVVMLLVAVALKVVLSTRIGWPRPGPRFPGPTFPRPRWPRPGFPRPGDRRRYGWKRDAAIEEVDDEEDADVTDVVKAVVRAVHELKMEEKRDQEDPGVEEY